MQNSHAGRRLGFILSTIHAGSALKLWHKVVQRAQTENGGNGGNGGAGGDTAAALTVSVTLGANVTEGGITVNGLSAGQYVVRCENGWSWRYEELTDVTVTVESGATAEARFDANLNNKNWLFGNCSGSLEPAPAAQQNSSSQQALPNDNKVRKPYRDFLVRDRVTE